MAISMKMDPTATTLTVFLRTSYGGSSHPASVFFRLQLLFSRRRRRHQRASNSKTLALSEVFSHAKQNSGGSDRGVRQIAYYSFVEHSAFLRRMKLPLPFLHKTSQTSPPKKSLRDPSKPPEGSVYCPFRRHAGSPSSFGGKDRGREKRKASPTNRNAEVTLSSKRLTSFEVRELEEAFNVFDANHDGKISVEELDSVLRSLGDNPSEQEVIQMVRDVDRDGDGYIDLEEFRILHSGSEGSWMNCDKELREAFRVFDADKNGFISVEELHNVMKRLRRSCSMEECRKMIRGVDKDGDGQVSFEEFQKMMA